MNERIPLCLSGTVTVTSSALVWGVFMYASVFACKQPSVMTGISCARPD